MYRLTNTKASAPMVRRLSVVRTVSWAFVENSAVPSVGRVVALVSVIRGRGASSRPTC